MSVEVKSDVVRCVIEESPAEDSAEDSADDAVEAAPEADDDSDFEDFEIPADDEDDEF